MASASCHAWLGIFGTDWHRHLAEAARRSNAAKVRRRVHTNAPVPDRSPLYADMARLFLQDLANIEAGIYPFPADHDGSRSR